MQEHIGIAGKWEIVATPEQLEKRLRDLARQIEHDFQNRTVCVVGVLEDGFVFTADLIRNLDLALSCQFVKPDIREVSRGDHKTTEIFYSPEVQVSGADVLLVIGVLQSGLTTDFLVRNLLARGAHTVKVAALLDRQTGRKVLFQPDYVGFAADENYVFGYGLGTPDKLGRNLSYLATTREKAAHITFGR